MAGKLSFSIAINLLTENFKKGTSTVKNSLRSMQAQILTFAAALGFAGVSLSNLISEIIRVARETSKATTALKNVSGSTARFAENLRFTTSLAKKYGVYVNDLTSNFAKFTAAASIAGMKMEDQKKLFESLSRAATGFGLSADESNGMFLAVTQMMGKGKIQAEELRGQLGERLPIAMQAMAKAAGTTVAGLDKIMKEGKLLSAEVLPKFADALNEMIPNVDTDNIETSLNRLKNAFQEIVNSSGAQNSYKALIDGLTALLQAFKEEVSNIFIGLAAVILFALTRSATKLVSSLSTAQDTILKNQERTQAQALLATEKRQLAELNLERAKANFIKATDAEILAAKAEMKKAEIALKAATTREVKALAAQEAAATKAAALQSTGAFASFKNFVTAGAGKIAASLKMMWASFGPALIVAGLTAVIGKLIDMYQEAKRVRNIFADYKKEMEQNKSIGEVAQLNALRSVATDINANLDKRKTALSELNSKLNTAYTIDSKTLAINKDINTEVDKRIKLLENAARAERYIQKQIETEDKLNEIYGKYGGKRRFDLKVLSEREKEGSVEKHFKYGKNSYLYSSRHTISGDLKKDIAEVDQLNKVLSDVKSNLKGLVTETVPSSSVSPINPEDNTKKTDLQKEEEKYAKSLQELTNKLNNRAISEEEYKAQLNDLNKATYDTLSGMLTPEAAAKNKTYQTVKTFSVSSEFSEAEANYRTELGKYSNLLKNGAINEEEYQKAKLDLLQSTIKAIASLDNLSEMEKTYLTGMLSEAQSLQSSIVKRPELKTYDTTFDYKKSGTEVLSGQLAVAKENLEKIKEAYNAGAKDLIDELNNAFNDVTTLEDALKIAEVKKDVKDLTKQLNDGMYSGVKDIASSSDRLVSAFSSLRDVMNDEDATAWERIMAVWNAMINTVDAFTSILKTIENITEVTKKLAKAKGEENSLVKEGASVVAAAAGQTAKEAIAAKEIATSKTVTAAYNAEMAAKTAAAYAAIPFAGAAIAAAQIAAMKSLVVASAIPGFTSGGYVTYGSTTGDKTLARVNKGELILNGQQQATLFQIANGKGIRTNAEGGKVEFEIRYDRLVGVLKNGGQKQRRGR